MRPLRNIFAAILLLGGAALWGSAQAGDAGRTPSPQPPRGQGEHCVANTDFMRRNHMKMMMAHRQDVLHEGVRTPQFNLSGCVNCHAVKGEDGQPVSFASPQHFCRSCHTYAAVKIDCFECHNSRPETDGKAAATTIDGEDAARLAAFLREKKQ
jgi:hypothetical protein